jgi:tRNA-2-methylthio-N6-dimethylallyladenosine synthase
MSSAENAEELVTLTLHAAKKTEFLEDHGPRDNREDEEKRENSTGDPSGLLENATDIGHEERGEQKNGFTPQCDVNFSTSRTVAYAWRGSNETCGNDKTDFVSGNGQFPCGRLRIPMNRAFDIGIESLRGALGVGPNVAAIPSDSASREKSTNSGQPGTFFLETFGCQMNDHDSEKVAGLLLSRGYKQVETPEAARMILYNTCSIREKAAQKVFSRLGEYRERGEGKIIGVLGCVAQQEGEAIFRRAPWVSLVCGSASYRKLPEMLAELEAGNKHVTGLDNDTDETFETEITRRDNPWRAYLTIIEGCDKSCAYCVVPHTRGPERSRGSESILQEVRQLAELGYSEVQLLGQTVNSYADPTARGVKFSELLLEVAQVAGIRRVRFTTSHPRDFGADIVEAIDHEPKLCDHIHLPVQSGSTAVLRAMARTYTREEYLEKIALIRGAQRPISITTDIIVGFPGETDEDFEETLTMLDEAQYDGVFGFKYSPRPNTPSLKLNDPITEEVKGKRLAMIQERQRVIQTVRNQAIVGQVLEVFVSNKSRREKQWSGHTTSNRVISFSSEGKELLGSYVPVRVTDSGTGSLTGVHVE